MKKRFKNIKTYRYHYIYFLSIGKNFALLDVLATENRLTFDTVEFFFRKMVNLFHTMNFSSEAHPLWAKIVSQY